MRLAIQKAGTLFLAFLMIIALFPTAQAAEARASYYFSRFEDSVTALGNGKIAVEFDVVSTHTMTTLGASTVYIYEKQSDGSYEKVKTYTSATVSNMLQSNTTHAYCCITYQGKAGTKYYAVVNYYAKDASGYENYKCTTNTVTA